MIDINNDMKKFKSFIAEGGGRKAGKYEIASTDLSTARAHAEKVLTGAGRSIDDELPDFDQHYRFAQRRAKMGWTERREMPVITSRDVREFQQRLKDGKIDITKPFSPTTNPRDPFPEGLRGQQAKDFLERGLKDGDKDDDVVSVKNSRVQLMNLKPIQQQIYVDESVDMIVRNGRKGAIDFLTKKSYFICSSDLYIIDGHHRFLAGLLIDPSLRVQCVLIDLPISKLLPMAVAYGDAIGNKRNR